MNILRNQKPQIMLLDLMMPGIDGFEVCRRTRQFSDIPIIFLSAKDDETDRLVGLNIGGDDYVTKPFHVKEIIARVYSLLRRTRGEVLQQTTSYMIRDLVIDKEKFTVLRNGQPIVLTPTEFNLLEVLSLRRTASSAACSSWIRYRAATALKAMSEPLIRIFAICARSSNPIRHSLRIS